MSKTPEQKAAAAAAKAAKAAAAKPATDPAAPIPGVTPSPVGAVPTISHAPAPSASDLDDIEVNDPEVLRPVELPLVIKPKDGGAWKNEAQASYAKTLNGYAYKNPTKFAAKKAQLLARLVEIGNNPAALRKYEAPGQNLEYKDKRFQQ